MDPKLFETDDWRVLRLLPGTGGTLLAWLRSQADWLELPRQWGEIARFESQIGAILIVQPGELRITAWADSAARDAVQRLRTLLAGYESPDGGLVGW